VGLLRKATENCASAYALAAAAAASSRRSSPQEELLPDRDRREADDSSRLCGVSRGAKRVLDLRPRRRGASLIRIEPEEFTAWNEPIVVLRGWSSMWVRTGMRGRAPIAALALALLAPAPAARAEQVLATVAQPTLVNGYGGRVVWSEYTGPRRYQLMTYANGVTSRVPVAPRAVPFDADLGPGPHAGVAAVYSRCRTEPHGLLESQQLPLYFTGRGCRLFEYDFGGRGERPIAGTHAPGASEYLPSIWRSSVAFVRVDSRRHGLARLEPSLYLRRRAGGATVRLAGGPRGRYANTFDPADAGGPGPIALDLRGARLAYAWGYVPGLPEQRCPVTGPFDAGDGQSGFAMRIERPGTRAVTVARTCGYGGYDALVSPVLGAGRLLYLRLAERDGPVWSSQTDAFDLRTHARAAGTPGRELTSIALSGGRTYASRFTPEHDRRTELVDLGAFAAGARR
jgi:hypothetical protein